MVECPSVKELLDKVKSLTRQTEGTFQTAWSDSFTSAFHCCEQGGFIYVDFPVPATLTRCFVTRAPAGATMNQRTTGPNASIDLNSPGIAQNNVILAANFHTHPLSDRVGGDPQPSRADMENAFARGVPGIVISRPGVWSYGPERRESTTNPKGYPGPIQPVAYNPVQVIKVPPAGGPPWTVSNQWPEGTGTLVRHKLSSANERVEENGDVIVLEWSSEGVHYGERLVEN
ncbi:hypothetical protein HD554DRAFT_1189068 [Boletus coccyginus]|nr:hypothetical protein HD554DRAFT_1189068 [Boletus coccyginus]